jgi:hypothetical protein
MINREKIYASRFSADRRLHVRRRACPQTSRWKKSRRSRKRKKA